MNNDLLRVFETESDYDSAKPDFVYPTVSYVRDVDEVYYMTKPWCNYFFIEALADGMTVTLSNSSQGMTAPANELEYSTDQQAWTTLPNNTASPAINTGERIYLRGNATSAFDMANMMLGIGHFNITQQCNVGGNIMSLLFNDDFEDKTDLTGYVGAFSGLFIGQPIVDASELILPATTLSMGCYFGMFAGCTSLTTAPALPATTLSMACYFSMFGNCSSLTTAPALPATTLANECYGSMFRDCTLLTTAPALPVTTLADGCYNQMFYGCTSLTTAPVLPATTLANECYWEMFDGCTNLNYIKMLATDISASTCLSGWVKNVSSTGTFVKNPALSESTIGRGADGIPVGWTVVDAE